jgi:hypothetical protein
MLAAGALACWAIAASVAAVSVIEQHAADERALRHANSALRASARAVRDDGIALGAAVNATQLARALARSSAQAKYALCEQQNQRHHAVAIVLKHLFRPAAGSSRLVRRQLARGMRSTNLIVNALAPYQHCAAP